MSVTGSAHSTVAAILKEQGIPPSGARSTSWQTFLRAHWQAVVAADVQNDDNELSPDRETPRTRIGWRSGGL